MSDYIDFDAQIAGISDDDWERWMTSDWAGMDHAAWDSRAGRQPSPFPLPVIGAQHDLVTEQSLIAPAPAPLFLHSDAAYASAIDQSTESNPSFGFHTFGTSCYVGSSSCSHTAEALRDGLGCSYLDVRARVPLSTLDTTPTVLDHEHFPEASSSYNSIDNRTFEVPVPVLFELEPSDGSAPQTVLQAPAVRWASMVKETKHTDVSTSQVVLPPAREQRATRGYSSSSTKTSIEPQRRTRKGLALACPHQDCPHSGTFSRQYELSRHLAAKHGGAESHQCPVPGCFKGAERTAFARSDKLTSHIRSCHRGVRLPCPSPDCSDQLWDCKLLWVHMKKAHAPKDRWERLEPGQAAIQNSLSPAYPACPWWACRKTLPLDKLLDHFMQHPQAELVDMTVDLNSQSYLPVKAGCPHAAIICDAAQGLLHGCHCPVTSVEIVCPLCGASCRDHQAFSDHLHQTHLIKEEEKAHYRAWKQEAQSQDVFMQKQKFSALKPSWYARKEPKFQCPSCEWSNKTVWGYSWVIDHHLGMLADPESLRPHRREILKLHPEFIDHPVWDDLSKPVRSDEAEHAGSAAQIQVTPRHLVNDL